MRCFNCGKQEFVEIADHSRMKYKLCVNCLTTKCPDDNPEPPLPNSVKVAKKKMKAKVSV